MRGRGRAQEEREEESDDSDEEDDEEELKRQAEEEAAEASPAKFLLLQDFIKAFLNDEMRKFNPANQRAKDELCAEVLKLAR